MSNIENELINFSEDEIMEMLNDTSQLVSKYNTNKLSAAAVAAQGSNALANNVEFWKWMGRNYSNSGIFNSSSTMQQYMAQGAGKEEWLIKQLQGKGYEWDWMKKQRGNIKNLFKKYDAGDVANRAASDVTEINLLTGKAKEYQMKAYTGKSNPNLKNTSKDMTVVTNAEKVNAVSKNGYKTEGFQNNNTIEKATDNRLQQIKDGKAHTSYNFKNVAGTMAKAGLIGCAIGIGTEAVSSYKLWKEKIISDEEYLKEILKSGGDAGVTAGISAGLMIPVAANLTAAGASAVITLPIAFVLSNAVNKVVAPCFGRGEYKEILSKAKYYQNIENVYDDLVSSMEYASEQYYEFASQISKQNTIHQELKKTSMQMNIELKDLYDSI